MFRSKKNKVKTEFALICVDITKFADFSRAELLAIYAFLCIVRRSTNTCCVHRKIVPSENDDLHARWNGENSLRAVNSVSSDLNFNSN